jgi:thiol-disulfide isomerase/thioredoxin
VKKVLLAILLLSVLSCKNEVTQEENIASLSFLELEPIFQKQNDTTYVINFWATWCKPCVKELPYFEAVNAMASEEKIKIILVSLDFPENLESHVMPFIKENNIKSEVILLADDNANEWIPKVDTTWSGAIPATVIYKADKRVFIEGSMTQAQIESSINSISM